MFGELVTLQLLIVGMLMGLGAWLHLTEQHEHVHEPIEHEHPHVHDEHHQHAQDSHKQMQERPLGKVHGNNLLRCPIHQSSSHRGIIPCFEPNSIK